MNETLLAHVVARFAPRQWENVATEALKFLLDGSAGDAPARLLAPLLTVPSGLRWQSQVSDVADASIPDLIGVDKARRPALILEVKFWAALTDNQPIGYLSRQRAAFPDPGPRAAQVRDHVLVFLVPGRRQAMVAHEVSQRMGSRSEHNQVLGLTIIDNGQLAVVVPWGQMLAQVQSCLDEAGDEGGLANLAQLRGLCDRAESEAMLPIHESELGSELARRIYDFHDIVDAVTDELQRRGAVSVRGLRAVGGKGYYGRNMSSIASRHDVQLSFLTWSWANRFPTPIWLRIWQPSDEVLRVWQQLEGSPGVACVDATNAHDQYLQIGLRVPTGVEADGVVAGLADVVERAASALPRAELGEGAEPAPEPDAAPSGEPHGCGGDWAPADEGGSA